MNRGNGYSRGKGPHSWRPVTAANSSPHHHTPNRADGSSSRLVSSTSDGNSQSSWQVVQPKSGGSVFQNTRPTGRQGQIQVGVSSSGGASGTSGGKSYNSRQAVQNNSGGNAMQNVTPTGCREIRAVVSSVSSTSDGKSHSTRQVVGRISGGSVNQTVTPAHRQGQGWSGFGSGSNSYGDTVRQSAASSNRINSSHGKHLELSSSQLNSVEKDVHKSARDTIHGWSAPVDRNRSFMESPDHLSDVSQLSDNSVLGNGGSEAEVPVNTGNSQVDANSEHRIYVFDICPPPKANSVSLKPSLMAMNKEKRREKERSTGGPKGELLRSGMVLLRSYLSSSEQVNILRICRQHGLGPAGFYQPRFSDGGEMHLKLMCFGEFWDPESSKYGEVRPMDHAKPPPVPQELLHLVDRAIKDSHSLISANSRVKNVEAILPPVKPDICLVNYYSKTGRLGLHQDKDEGRFSLGKGIPIVSFSIGDSAEFLYSDQRDAEKAEKIILKSGDVLIFGGKSRHIFHGVPAIQPDTAPKWLLEETNFRPGRLNLTFRQHL